MKHLDSFYLLSIIDSIQKIEKYIAGVSEEDFLKNDLVQDGVIRQLQQLGEASKHLSFELRAHHHEIPWQDLGGARDKLIHDYFGVDIGQVWMMVCEDIPLIKNKIIQILETLQKTVP